MQGDDPNRERGQENLDELMERDTAVRRDTQVRGSLGTPPSGESSSGSPSRDQAIPEFGRMDDEDRPSER